MRKTALITGITGQDGAYLARKLLEKEYQVFGTSRDAYTNSFSKLKKLGILEKVSISSMAPNDFRSVFKTIDTIRPNEIYNLAGQSSVGLSFEQPVEAFESISVGTLNLLEVIRLCSPDTKFFNASSSDCFGNIEIGSFSEESPFRPCSPYSVAKVASHWTTVNYRESYKIWACNGIMSNHDSPLRPGRFVTQKIVQGAIDIAKAKEEGKHLTMRLGNLECYRDFGYAPEYADAMWNILQCEVADDFIIATGKTRSLKHFAAVVFDQLDLNADDHIVYDPALVRPSDIHRCSLDPSKISMMTPWKAQIDMVGVAKIMVWDAKKNNNFPNK